MRDPDDRASRDVRAEAASWLARKDRGLSPAGTRALERWLSADARHAREFDRLKNAWSKIDPLASKQELKSMADGVVVRVRKRRNRRRVLTAVGVISVGLALFLSLTKPARRAPDSPVAPRTVASVKHYKVLPSEARRLSLTDGSFVELNGGAEVDVDFSGAQRVVTLKKGEAYFVVAKDASRPFSVVLPTFVVQAVGTEFDVDSAAGAPQVLVTEGSVQMLDRTMTKILEPVAAGHGIRLAGTGAAAGWQVDKLTSAAIDAKLAWRSTRFDFFETPLQEVVDAFNGYNERKLALASEQLKNVAMTGVFPVDKLDAFLKNAPAIANVKPVPVSPMLIRLEPLP